MKIRQCNKLTFIICIEHILISDDFAITRQNFNRASDLKHLFHMLVASGPLSFYIKPLNH